MGILLWIEPEIGVSLAQVYVMLIQTNLAEEFFKGITPNDVSVSLQA